MRLFSQVPVFGRLARRPALPPTPPPSTYARLRKGLSPRRLTRWLQATPPAPAPLPSVPLIGPVLRRVRQPIAQTARVVRAAREVRRPQTRWERLREAALQVIEDPVAATRWERLMGLGMGLANGSKPVTLEAGKTQRSALACVLKSRGRAAHAPEPGLREQILEIWRRPPTTAQKGQPGLGRRRDRPSNAVKPQRRGPRR